MSIFCGDQASIETVLSCTNRPDRSSRPVSLFPTVAVVYYFCLRRLTSPYVASPRLAAALLLLSQPASPRSTNLPPPYYSPVHLAPTQLARGTATAAVFPSYSVCSAAYSLAPLPSLGFWRLLRALTLLAAFWIEDTCAGCLCNSLHRAIVATQPTQRRHAGNARRPVGRILEACDMLAPSTRLSHTRPEPLGR